MTTATTAELVAAAQQQGRAVLAFNVITLAHAEAIAAGAEATGTAVIMQISENALRFHHGQLDPIVGATAAVAAAASVPIAVHLDHLTDPALAANAAAAGASSLMFDAGALPYAQNVAQTAAVTRAAHAEGLWVEAELGYVGGKADAPQSAHAAGVRTDPGEAGEFVAATGVDALAVAVGSTHAMTTQTARLDHDLIRAIRARVPVPLVLHGSSGVPPAELRAGVAAGLVKVNVGTALNVALTASVRATLAAQPTLTDPRKYLAPGRDAMREVVINLIRALDASASSSP